ncbi:hypothetical protein ACOMHN_061735 [Nucella lapillus]
MQSNHPPKQNGPRLPQCNQTTRPNRTVQGYPNAIKPPAQTERSKVTPMQSNHPPKQNGPRLPQCNQTTRPNRTVQGYPNAIKPPAQTERSKVTPGQEVSTDD